MDLKVVHDTINFYINKEEGAYLSPAQIDDVLDRAQMALFNQYHTNPKIPSKAQSELYGESQRIDDALSQFKEKQTFNNAQTQTPPGVITLNTDYQHLIALYTTSYNNSLGRNVYSSVEVLVEDELIDRLESQVVPVSSDPIAVMSKQNKIQLFPEVPSSGAVYYFRRPAKPVFAFTQNGRVITYNQSGSTQLEWKDMDINNIISIALSYYGLNMSNQNIVQFAELKNSQGQ